MVKLSKPGDFDRTVFISQSQDGVQKVWVNLICMFVKHILRVMKMQQGGDFPRLCRMTNFPCRMVKFFVKRPTDSRDNVFSVSAYLFHF